MRTQICEADQTNKDDLKSDLAISEIFIFRNAMHKCNLLFMLNFLYILVQIFTTNINSVPLFSAYLSMEFQENFTTPT
jgi:hypothetical protein